MAYSTDILRFKADILNQLTETSSDFGTNAGGITYTHETTVYCSVDWSRGVKAIREGALDAYDTIMVRCRWNSNFTRESCLRINGKCYAVTSFHDDYQRDTIQATCVEVQDLKIVEPTPPDEGEE